MRVRQPKMKRRGDGETGRRGAGEMERQKDRKTERRRDESVEAPRRSVAPSLRLLGLLLMVGLCTVNAFSQRGTGAITGRVVSDDGQPVRPTFELLRDIDITILNTVSNAIIEHIYPPKRPAGS